MLGNFINPTAIFATRGVRLALCLLASLLLNACVIAPRMALVNGPEHSSEQVVESGGDNKVLLLPIKGVISSETPRSLLGLSGSVNTVARVDAALKRAAKDPKVKAIVLHINTPGGGVTASDDIHALLARHREETGQIVVAALADLATSGGYYIACAADQIVMHPTGITGSIGVILTKYDFSGLLAKVGVADDSIAAGRYKKLLTPTRAATADETELLQNVIDSMHRRFIDVVLEGRPRLNRDNSGNITDGRIFNAAEAERLGLVDEQGRLSDAIDAATRLAKLENPTVIRYRHAGIGGDTIYASTANAGQPSAVGAVLPLQARHPQLMYLWPGAL